jgi:hypothetical protein
MEEATQQQEKKQKFKETLAKKGSLKVGSPTKKKADKDDDIERDTDEDVNAKVGAKTSLSKEGSLMERGAKPRRQKIVIPSPKVDAVKSATIIKGKLEPEDLIKRKSAGVNKLLEIDNRAKVLENLHKVKVEDTRITTECDVSLISDRTIEALLKFLDLNPEDNRFDMDKKLNARRIDIQGTKPNKFRKQEVPEKADVISNIAESEDEDDEDEDEEKDKSAVEPKTEARIKDSDKGDDSEDDKKDKKDTKAKK